MTSLERAPRAATARRPPMSSRAAPLRTVQPRARVTREALLAAGRALLADRDFDALSISELAGAIGLSVGSFYGRFRDKESFFSLLLVRVTGEWRETARAALDPAILAGLPARAVVERACAVTVEVFRRDAGFLRAALKHASTHPASWTPIKRVGQSFVDGLVAALGPRLGRLAPAQREARIRFAMQMLFGTVVNAVLNDPGPLPLDDERLEAELACALSAYLEIR